jgi:FlgD Ig-like domain
LSNVNANQTITVSEVPILSVQEHELPRIFTLSQNFPNPFNPATRIKYDLPEQAIVTLRIYNVLGQEIATLANGKQEPGSFERFWDGHNSFGVPVSSGIYLYRLDATSVLGTHFSSLKKMILLK